MSAKRRESKRKRRASSKAQSLRRKLRRTYRRLEAFDGTYLSSDDDCLVGIDEAGRGALAGPVVAAAVSLPRNSQLVGVNDSKTLSEDEREALFGEIVAKARSVGISFSQPPSIDRNNVLNASLMAMAQALGNLRVEANVVLLDGRDEIHVPTRVVAVVGGDGKSLSIAAASIVAKVARDRMMRRLHRKLPAYNFITNKGYGTKEHLEAIRKFGPSDAHRMSYRSNVVENSLRLF